MPTSLLLLLAVAGGCRETYDECVAPCQSVYDACREAAWDVRDGCSDDCWADPKPCGLIGCLDCCTYDAQQVTDECHAAFVLCDDPCRDVRWRCEALRSHKELTACLTGPVSGGVWCQVRGSLWEMLTGGAVVTCLDALPTWCEVYDVDKDGDVDLRDFRGGE